MRTKTILTSIMLIMIMVLIPVLPVVSAVSAVGQETSVFTGGLVYQSGWALDLSIARRIAGTPVWVGLDGKMGSSAEIGGQAAAMFELIENKLYGGPVANLVSDFSNKPGTEGLTVANYLTNAAGVALAYSLSQKLGGWGFAKYQSSFGDNAYKDGWIIAAGFYFMV